MHARTSLGLIVALAVAIGFAAPASAQVKFVQGKTVPVEAGKLVFGIMVYPSGMYTVGRIKVEGVVSDDMFSYWEGSYKGDYYYYDPYSQRWMSGPVTYRRASLKFQDELVEGWVRDFSGLVDYNHFFGNDGDTYKRVNIFKRNKRDRKLKTRIVYTYFRNMATGERSDGGKIPHIRIEGATIQYVNEESRWQEDNIQLIVEAFPDLAEWKEAAEAPPAEVVATEELPKTEDPSLAQLIEKELGPLEVGPQRPK